MSKHKAIVIIGPTSSGKTALAVKLAHKFNGEIVSADSRQVYKGMDLGTGKDLDEYKFKDNVSKCIKIKYHLIDVVSPKTIFSLSDYLQQANQALDKIAEEKKLPIIAGGSGLYIQALVDNFTLSNVKPNSKLRQTLEKLSVDELYQKLQQLSANFAHKLTASDKKNKRRLIRYIEIYQSKSKAFSKEKHPKFKFLVLGLNYSITELRQRINLRLEQRLKVGLVDEVKILKKSGLSWQRLESFGLEYKYVSQYLQNKMSYDDMVEKLSVAIGRFAKRQNTWFRRWQKQGRKIVWVKDFKEAEKKIKKFI